MSGLLFQKGLQIFSRVIEPAFRDDDPQANFSVDFRVTAHKLVLQSGKGQMPVAVHQLRMVQERREDNRRFRVIDRFNGRWRWILIFHGAGFQVVERS